VRVRRCGRTPGNPREKPVESLAKLHIAPLSSLVFYTVNQGRWREAHMLIIPGDRFSGRIHASGV
jgi:hypothetical protein